MIDTARKKYKGFVEGIQTENQILFVKDDIIPRVSATMAKTFPMGWALHKERKHANNTA